MILCGSMRDYTYGLSLESESSQPFANKTECRGSVINTVARKSSILLESINLKRKEK